MRPQTTSPFRRKQGNVLDVQTRGALLKDEEGQTVGSLITIRDITAQKEMERALQTSEARYREILEDIEDGYYETNLKGEFVFMNEQGAAFHGFSIAEMMGKNYRLFSLPEIADD